MQNEDGRKDYGAQLEGRRYTRESGNRNATAISENCYQPELSSANSGNGNATRRKTEKLNYQATEQAVLLTIALPSCFLVSAVL
jgi:hypothetical protein